MEILHSVEILVAILLGLFALIPKCRTYAKMLWEKTLGRRGVQLSRIEAELRPNGGDSLRDVLDRIEKAQIGIEAFNKAHLNILEGAVFRTDEKGDVIYVNRQFQRLTGFSPQEVAGAGWVNLIHPAERSEVKAKWALAVQEGREFSEDLTYIKPDGIEFYKVHAYAFRELGRNNEVLGYLGIIVPLDPPAGPCPWVQNCRRNT